MSFSGLGLGLVLGCLLGCFLVTFWNLFGAFWEPWGHLWQTFGELFSVLGVAFEMFVGLWASWIALGRTCKVSGEFLARFSTFVIK